MNNKNSEDKVVSVFYNSACPVCNAGINYQKKRMSGNTLNNSKIIWNDVHFNNQFIKQLSPNTELDYVRERLHVKDASGEVLVGIDTFIALWKLSPGESWKANVISSPLIYDLAVIFYNVFAFCLFRWNRIWRHG